MSNLKEKVLLCKECGSSQIKVEYGNDQRYPDDYNIQCLECDNWEEGNGRPHGFDIEYKEE